MRRIIQQLIQPLDLAAAGLVLLLAVLAALPLLARDEGGSVRIVYDGGTLTLPLDEDCTREFISGGHTLVIAVENGGARVSDADCPDRLCVNSGVISRAGESVICLPGRLLMEITGSPDAADTEVDGVAG
ncbi:MAG: NusG domain II-containing protein [Clostridia bacterium]|nr:NusG domain II-containing protein [Clostridia bacterium]